MEMRNTIYHIYNRGNHQETIYFDNIDHYYFRKLLKETFNPNNFDLISYCLMPNHFHILIVKNGKYSVYKSMQSLQSQYARYINKKYYKTGHLFQGKYNKKTVCNLYYFQNITDYIKHNPDKIKGYKWFEENELLLQHYYLELSE